jgi:hypothetical protein
MFKSKIIQKFLHLKQTEAFSMWMCQGLKKKKQTNTFWWKSDPRIIAMVMLFWTKVDKKNLTSESGLHPVNLFYDVFPLASSTSLEPFQLLEGDSIIP